jgi:hypothetical protein
MARVGVKIPQDRNRANVNGHVAVVHKHVWRTLCSVCATGARVAQPYLYASSTVNIRGDRTCICDNNNFGLMSESDTGLIRFHFAGPSDVTDSISYTGNDSNNGLGIGMSGKIVHVDGEGKETKSSGAKAQEI